MGHISPMLHQSVGDHGFLMFLFIENQIIPLCFQVPGPVRRPGKEPPERVLVLEGRGAEMGVGDDEGAILIHRRQYRAAPDGRRYTCSGAA